MLTVEFFVPSAESEEVRDTFYEAIKQHLATELDAEIADTRIRLLEWERRGIFYEAEVGQNTEAADETVIAILYEPARSRYHVCTPSRGIVRDRSIIVSQNHVRRVVEFD